MAVKAYYPYRNDTSAFMTFLYDANNNLVPVEKWPSDLAELKKHVGNGYCCVSENKPEKGNEPPAGALHA